MDLLFSRMMVFDEEGGSGSTQSSKEIMSELNELMENDNGETETPKATAAEDIDLEEKEDEGPAKASEEIKEEKTPVEEEKKEEVKEDPKTSEVDELRKDFMDFASTQLKAAGISSEEALTGEKEEVAKVEKPAPVKVEEPPPVKAVKVKPVELSDELWEKIKDDKESFIEFMESFKSAIASSVKEEVLLESIPTIQKYSRNYITSVNQVEVFYRENPELNPYRTIVGFIAAKLGQEKPELNKDEIISTAGKEAYRLLKLTKGKTPPDNGAQGTTRPPAFGVTGTRKSKPGEKVYKNKMQEECEEMKKGQI